MKKLLFLTLLMCSLNTFAQNCDKEALKSLPGIWKPQPKDAITGKLSATEISGAKNVMAKIRDLFQQQYKPIGVDAYHYFHFSDDYFPGSGTYGNRTIYTIRNFDFYCLNGIKKTSAEGTGSFIHINRGGTLTNEFAEKPIYDEHGKVNRELNNGGGFYSFTPVECKDGKLPDLSKGYHIVDEGNTYSVWITKKNQTPYRYISRKEFLEKQVVIADAKRKELEKDYSKPEMLAAMNAAGGAYKEDILKGKQLALDLIEKPLAAYKEDLKKDTAWLNEMAVVKFEGGKQFSRFVFTTLDDGFMFVPIMPNADYYDKKQPKWVPQFILIEVRGSNTFHGKNVQKVVDDNIEFFKTLLVK
ncbi:MAG: hypothetical protein KF862_05600 [Chitinophagaceae bacterium]|nr:hypothetical protein [Chitinophagaceae bacterium]